MAVSKRRADAPAEQRPEKKQRSDKQREKPTDKQRPAQVATLLRNEEEAFPRGGANVLTPLEHRQIQIKAKQDVLFEQSTGKKPSTTFDSSDDENELAEEQPASKVKTTKERKPKNKDKKAKGTKNESVGDQDNALRIEGLSYRRIVPGTVILGQVSNINKHDITINLPNNLVGYLPLTSISAKVTEAIEALVAEEEEEDTEAPDDLQLADYLSVGQYIRVCVTSTGSEGQDGKDIKKRHIALSAVPDQVNGSLGISDLITDNVIQAAVESVEDHGLIMSLGMEDHGVRGFISSKELLTGTKISDVKPGAVMMCIVLGMNTNGKTVKLSANTEKMRAHKKAGFLANAPSVDTFLPGCAVDVLVSEVTEAGLAGKVMGMLDVTADWIHSARDLEQKPLAKRHPVGSQVKARVICTFPTSSTKKLGISILPHLLTLSTQKPKKSDQAPTLALPVSSFVDEAKVVAVEPKAGLILDVGVKGVSGFAHISQLSDEKVTTISAESGPYKVGTSHRARVRDFNAIDGLFVVSLQESILQASFLRRQDVQVGSVVNGVVEKANVGTSGKFYVVLKLGEGINGLVTELHLSDIRLKNPEHKFKIGTKVSARVLDNDVSNKRILLTCKKSLVNSDAQVWKSFTDPQPGEQSPGTIASITPSGAVVTYYGGVKAFLPASEMSESFVKDPQLHFKVGQVVTTHPLRIQAQERQMTVSCRDISASGPEQRAAFEKLTAGSLVTGTVSEKSQDQLVVELDGSGLKGTLSVEHLADGSANKCANLAKKIRVGQNLKDLLVLRKNQSNQVLQLSLKPALLKASQAGKLPSKLEDLEINREVVGFVGNITKTAIFVNFAQGLTGLLPVGSIADDKVQVPDFGLRNGATITAKVLSIDSVKEQFVLSQKDDENAKEQASIMQGGALVNAVDGLSKHVTDFQVGTKTTAKVQSIKDTQLNVVLADNVQGRIDVSQVFDTWDKIKDHKNPLRSFTIGQELPVRVLGKHDARNHRFLPLTHVGKSQVLELTAKPSKLASKKLTNMTFKDIEKGKEYICFVNNIENDILWVNITPGVRGRIRARDASDNVSLLRNLDENFPVGAAIRARVTNVDATRDRIDLSARSGTHEIKSLSDLAVGMVLQAEVTRVSERQVMVQLSDMVSGPVNLVELADDYSKADPTKYDKGSIVRVHVSAIDKPNKKVTLSMRPSKILSSTLTVTDRDFKSAGELELDLIVRGFVKNVSEKGVFVALSSNVSAFVPIRELSDTFLVDWKSKVEIDELVKGRVTALDPAENRVQISLKESALDKNYRAPLSATDLKVGQFVTGKIKSVEDFGVFVTLDNSHNVSGLVHKSQMADELVTDVKKLYGVGDAVKAKVLRVNLAGAKRQISFGLKASYFRDADTMEIDEGDEGDSADEGIELGGEEEAGSDAEEIDGIDKSDEEDMDSDDEGIDISSTLQVIGAGIRAPRLNSNMGGGLITNTGLNVGGFDWTGKSEQQAAADDFTDSEPDGEQQKKRRKKAQIQVDRTAELDVEGPQSTADFERLLMTEPNRADLWIGYMGYYLQLNDIVKAREIAERAIKTVNHQSRDTEQDALDVWTAYLNLESAYGSEEALEALFARAKQYNDAKEIHSRFVSNLIQSGKHEQADALFQTMIKKFSQDPAVWHNYAGFLFDTMKQPVQGRELLKRALQALPRDHHFDTTVKFAHLEFRSENGETERGRTMFEGLLSTFPKRTDLYNVYLDLEMKSGDKDTVRRLFQRATSSSKLKPKQAKYFFKRWDEWELKNGDAKSMEKVKAKAEEWVRKHSEGKDAK